MNTLKTLCLVLDKTLGLKGQAQQFDATTPLLGDVPELDSMAVVLIIQALEKEFDICIDDDEVSAELFETVGDLHNFVEFKYQAKHGTLNDNSDSQPQSIQ